MRRGSWWLIAAGIAVFLVTLFLYLPASWFAAALPAGIRCAELGGSVWHGECLGLNVRDQNLGDATWNLAAGRAITGRLVGDVDVRGGALTLRADVDSSFGGSGELRKVSARFPLDPAFIAQLPENQRGSMVVELERIAFADGKSLRALEGVIELHEFRQLNPRALPLGSYQLRFDGGGQDPGKFVGQLRDLGGPFSVGGTVTLTPPASYLVSGNIAGRGPEAESLVREITLGAPADSSGMRPFSFEGSY